MKFIFGKLNHEGDYAYSNNKVFAWRVPDGMGVSVGDYALVENLGAFDLVEVCAIAATDEVHGRYITGYGGGINKYVLATITKEALIHLSQKARGEE